MIALLITLTALLLGCTDKHITNNYGPADWRPPVVEWLTQPDAELRGLVGIHCQVTDSSAIARVVLYVDGVADSVTTETRPRFELITDSLLDGVHLLEVRAWDEFDNLGVSPILRINVVNSVAQGPRLIWVPDDYARIQDAINAAMDFDTIRVRNGTYYETLNLFGKGIWIESERGPLSCIVDNAGANNAFLVPACQVPATVRGFWMRGAGYLIYMTEGAQATFANNICTSDSADGMVIALNCGGSIRNNLFSGSRTSLQLAYFWGDVENNIIQCASDFALWNASTLRNPVFHDYNAFWQNRRNYTANFTPGAGEFDGDPLIDLAAGTLMIGSPCIDTGDPLISDLDNSRSDIGPFGGPFAYW